MANGITLTDRWSMRLVSGRRVLDGATLTSTGEVLGARTSRLYATEVGGELAHATWPDGYTWTAPLGTLRLQTVTRRGRPAPGTVVRLDGTDYQATADTAGLLELTGLLPGPYTASILDPRLGALGVSLATPLRFIAVRDSAGV